ncbi:MAG: hexitol phosphatase HxpB [Chitinophagaceae bacterium]|nr:hexitol phosphatase HxpB [Chitinophagaceae bacterium]
MQQNAVIFDMDGLLIDSEPLWQKAGQQALLPFNIELTAEQYHSSTGLRTPEWIEHWFTHFNIDTTHSNSTIDSIETLALNQIQESGLALPGVEYIMEFFAARKFKIGLASSSPLKLIEMVVDKLQIRSHLDAITSAEGLPFGKPHPQVFINCAEALGIATSRCIVFEDSFNGMIAAKAAKMRCVVVPEATSVNSIKWGAADLQLESLLQFNEKELVGLGFGW